MSNSSVHQDSTVHADFEPAAGPGKAPRILIDHGTGQKLTNEIKAAYAMLDAAIAQSCRLNAAMIETGSDIGLAPEKGQKLYKGLAACVTAMVESRQELLGAHLQATRIRLQSNQAETDYGCLLPFGQATHLQAVA